MQERDDGLLWSPQSFYLPLFTLAKVLSGVLVWLEGYNTPQWEFPRNGTCKTQPTPFNKNYLCKNPFQIKSDVFKQAALPSWQMFCCLHRHLVNKRRWWLSAVSVRCGKSCISFKSSGWGFVWLELSWHRPSHSLYSLYIIKCTTLCRFTRVSRIMGFCDMWNELKEQS